MLSETILMMKMLRQNEKKKMLPHSQNTEFNWILFTLHAKFVHSIPPFTCGTFCPDGIAFLHTLLSLYTRDDCWYHQGC